MKRIEALRAEALCYSMCKDEFYYRFYKRFFDSAIEDEYKKYSDAYFTAFSELTPVIREGELIVGRTEDCLTPAESEEWKSEYEERASAFCESRGGGQDSHMAIDYPLVLGEGLLGIIAKIDGYLEGAEPEKRGFYLAAKSCLNAVIAHSEHYSELAAELAERESDGERKAELYELARICKKVPANPAESFYEAVQATHFITYCVSLDPWRFCTQQFQLGRPDRYLLPYYERDIKSGAITRERAQLLLDCLGIQINIRVRHGLSSGYMVGGRTGDGRIVANELTEMLMQVVDDIRLVYPSVGLCYTEGMPERYLKLACEILSHGRSHPAIFNDDIISKGLRSYGVPDADSHEYIHSTCVEITPIASSNVWVASPYTNMAQLLLDTMTREYDSFDEHFAIMLKRLDESIKKNFEWQNGMRKDRAERSMNPLLSCLVNDCLERGKDIERGGARYNWIMPSFVGVANLVDSLYAMKRVVYDEKRYTVRELREILDRNFEGEESLRLYLLRELPKYGNDIDEIDAYFTKITGHIIAECKKYRGLHSSANLIPSVFCWIMHEMFGRETGATPDGRLKGFPLGDGSGPCQGREMRGPTASILSSTKWEHHELIGGVAVNMKFAKSTLGEHSLEVMQSLIKAFMERGGFEFQINVTDRELLELARKHPEEHSDLVVRIGGYSDYFTTLSPEMQEELILRTEHTI